MLHLILLVFAFVLFVLAGWLGRAQPAWGELHRLGLGVVRVGASGRGRYPL